ncbi:MAG: cell division protein FtsA [Clostridia bacterium]|nr:cell division protein FtsA [Clostridia bacterium]
MAIGDIIVGLDIGASKVCSLVGQVNKFNEVEVIGYGMASNTSVKKGKIIYPGEAAKAVRQAVLSAEDISGLAINSAYVNCKGCNVRTERITLTANPISVNDGLTVQDMDNLFDKFQMSVMLEKGEQIIDILPIEYIVNGKKYNQDPLGAFCREFEATADVMIAKGDYLDAILETFNIANLKLDGIICETIATSNIIVIPEEKKAGVLLVDVGAGHTDISVYKDMQLQFYDTIPVGGDHITNDISLTLKISQDEANKIKRQYNLALQAMIKNNHEVRLTTVSDPDFPNVVRCSDIVEIIEARVKEIFHIIRKIIVENKLESKIECMVLTGQGLSNIVGVEELAMLILKQNQVRICLPKLVNTIKPQHTTVFGMVRYIASLGGSKHVNSEVEIVTDPQMKDRLLDVMDIAKSKLRHIFGKNNRRKNKEEF